MLKSAFLSGKPVLLALSLALASCNRATTTPQPPQAGATIPNPATGTLNSPAPLPLSVHERQKALIQRIVKMSPQDAAALVTQFAPPATTPGPDPRKQLQVMVANTDDPQVLSRMEQKFPQ
jgi:hypothetical protein